MPRKSVPVLNPVLRLLTEKRPAPITGGGKNKNDIINSRLRKNRQQLPKKLNQIRSSVSSNQLHAGKVLLHAQMSQDRLRPTLTPDSLFNEKQTASKLVTSVKDGFIVEAELESFDLLSEQISTGNAIATRVDISSLKDIQLYSLKQQLEDDGIQNLWSKASTFSDGKSEYKKFSTWLLPFSDIDSKRSIIQLFKSVAFPFVYNSLPKKEKGCWTSSNCKLSQQEKLDLMLNNYLKGRSSNISLSLTKFEQLSSIIASGTVCRIDPVTAIQTSVAPGTGTEPNPPTPKIACAPIVAVVDGGLSARTYQVAVAWKPADFFVPKFRANLKHGNQVASLVVDATGWNNNLDIPDSPCRIAPIQVVPKDIDYPFSEEDLLEYLDQLMGEHSETKVWNFSFNQERECSQNCVSRLGNGLHEISRKHAVLPIVSAGNKAIDQILVAPPADCESALIVGGRNHNQEGKVDEPWELSRNGLGPCQSLCPDLSWYSRLRVIGGKTVRGTSYSAPLVSRIAAYLFANLKDPTPDLVRALIINSADRATHDYQLGWGSPTSEYDLWNCSPNSVTLAWTSTLESGQEYHWHDIIVPPTMLNNGKLRGEITLTTVLTPLVDHDNGIGHYFMSRLETNVQVLKKNGEGYTGLLRGCETNGTKDKAAIKWSPIRHSRKTFTKTSCTNGKVNLRARIYLRDKYKIKTTVGDNHIGVSAEVAFALTFRCTDKDEIRAAKTYNEFCNLMRNNVENATIEVQEQTQILS